MATHSSVLAWRIPGAGKPGGLPSMGMHRVRHDFHDLQQQQQQHGFLKTSSNQGIPEAFPFSHYKVFPLFYLSLSLC